MKSMVALSGAMSAVVRAQCRRLATRRGELRTQADLQGGRDCHQLYNLDPSACDMWVPRQAVRGHDGVGIACCSSEV